MSSVTPNRKKRSCLLPPGCKDLIHLLHGVRASDVGVIGERGQQLGIMPLVEALRLAQSRNVDLIEIAPNARPPVCRLVDYGKFRYELSKRRKRKA